jgi:ubiquinone biosynthesis protein COQ4
MKKIILYVNVVVTFLKLVRDPNKTELVAKFCENLCELGYYKHSLQQLKANPTTAEIFRLRPRLPLFEPSRLAEMPHGTVGQIFGKNLLQQGFDPNYFRIHPDKSDSLYICVRNSETHDLWHVVTGFDTSVAGELGLQAFMIRQLGTPQSAIFLAGGLLRAVFKDPTLIIPIMDEIVHGWQMAKTYPPLFAVDWEAILPLPLESVKQTLRRGQLDFVGNLNNPFENSVTVTAEV